LLHVAIDARCHFDLEVLDQIVRAVAEHADLEPRQLAQQLVDVAGGGSATTVVSFIVGV
jgi:hypothetical protein